MDPKASVLPTTPQRLMFVWRFSVWKNLEEGSFSLIIMVSKLSYFNIISSTWLWIDSNDETLHQKPNQTTLLGPKYAKTHPTAKSNFKNCPGRTPDPSLKGKGRVCGGWGEAPQTFGGSRGRKVREGRDRGGDKGVPPHSTTHFNHWLHANYR